MSNVRVNGQWLSAIGFVGDLKWSSRWGEGPSGCDLASWTFDVDQGSTLDVLTPGAEVEIVRHGKRVWFGHATEPVRGRPWQMNAEGKARRASLYPALDAAGAPTVNPSTALTNSGVPWMGWSGFENADFGVVEKSKVNYLDALLNDWAKAKGLKWGVGPNGYGFASADPTTPSLILHASEIPIGVAEEGDYTRVVARYVSAMAGDPAEASAWATVSVGTPGRTFIMDLTQLGLLTSGTATSYANAQLDLFRVPTWTSRITASAASLTTLAGAPADLGSVQAGQMVRLQGAPKMLGRTRQFTPSVVLGEVEWVDGSSEITLAPVNLAVRSIVDEVAARAKAREMVPA